MERDLKVGKIIKSDIKSNKVEKHVWIPMTKEEAEESFKRLDWKLQKELLAKGFNGSCLSENK